MKKIFTTFGVLFAMSTQAQIVINEVYGGGGNSGSVYKNDFIELKNIGTTTITLTNATLQYGSAANAISSYHNLPSITLAPGSTYLIQEGAGSGGTTDLPTPDFIAPIPTNFGTGTNTTAGFSMSASNGKIALASDNVQVLTANASNVLDFVGYGTANLFEGAAAAVAPSNTNSISRISGDTQNNQADFAAGAPSPLNSNNNVLAVANANKNKGGFVKNTLVKNNEIYFEENTRNIKMYNFSGQIVKSALSGNVLNIADLPKGNYIINGEVDNQNVSVKIVKD